MTTTPSDAAVAAKACGKCGVVKELSCFSRHSGKLDGLRSMCKVCSSASTAAWQADNPGRHAARCAIWRAANPERAAANSAAWRAANPERNAANVSAWHAANRNRIDASHVASNARHPIRAKARAAFRNAIRAGRVERPDFCEGCLRACRPHGHHWSYAQEHWLDVIFLCANCHAATHKTLDALNLEIAV